MPLVTTLSYLPSVEWFSGLIANKEAVIDHEMHYERQMGLNQTTILGAGGKLKLSVPVQNHRNHMQIKDILISNENAWQKKHWQSIRSSYGGGAWFLYYADKLEMAFHRDFIFLKDWNETMFMLSMEFLKLQIPISFAEDFQKQYAENYIDKRRLRKNETPVDRSVAYRQVFTGEKFIPGLSIIDLVFNEGPDSGKYLVQKSKK